MIEPHTYRLVDLGNRRLSSWDFPCPEPGVVELAFEAQVPCPPCSFGFPFPSTCSNLGEPREGLEDAVLMRRSPNSWDGMT